MNIRPLDDRLVVKQAEAEAKTASGIFFRKARRRNRRAGR